MKNRAKAALRHRDWAEKEDDSLPEKKLTTYFQVVNLPFVSFATAGVITEVKAELNNFKQPGGMSTARYSIVLLEITLRCGYVYHESPLKRVFVE